MHVHQGHVTAVTGSMKMVCKWRQEKDSFCLAKTRVKGIIAVKKSPKKRYEHGRGERILCMKSAK